MSESLKPDHIPLARPVSLDSEKTIGQEISDNSKTPFWPTPLSPIRAVVELLILIVCGIAAAWAGYVLSLRIPHPDPRWQQLIGSAGVGLFLIIMCCILVRLAGHPLSSLGWTARDLYANVGIGLGAWVATYIVIFSAIITTYVMFPAIMPDTPVAQQEIEKTFPPMPLYCLIPLTIFVAFWEEIVFRGFVLTRLNTIFRRWWLTIVLASAVFGAIHIYEGLLAVLMITCLALVMSILFVMRRSLIPSIVFHFLHNLFMFLLLDSISQTWK